MTLFSILFSLSASAPFSRWRPGCQTDEGTRSRFLGMSSYSEVMSYNTGHVEELSQPEPTDLWETSPLYAPTHPL